MQEQASLLQGQCTATSKAHFKTPFKNIAVSSPIKSLASQANIKELQQRQSLRENGKIKHELNEQGHYVCSAMASSNVNAYQLICGTWDYGSSQANEIQVIELSSQQNHQSNNVSNLMPIRSNDQEENELRSRQSEKVYQLTQKGRTSINFPVSKLLSAPVNSFSFYDVCSIFASASDCIRLYRIKDQDDMEYRIEPLIELGSVPETSNGFNSPIPSFDWWQSMIACVHLDRQLTLWDANMGVATVRIEAHQKQVFDVSFDGTGNQILTAGADGRVNLFDVRDMTNPKVLYMTNLSQPIIKASWSKNSDQSIFAVLEAYQHTIKVFDAKFFKQSVYQLQGHSDQINCLEWESTGKPILCSAGQDGNTFIWDLSGNQHSALQQFPANYPILSSVWVGSASDWIGLSYSNQITAVKL